MSQGRYEAIITPPAGTVIKGQILQDRQWSSRRTGLFPDLSYTWQSGPLPKMSLGVFRDMTQGGIWLSALLKI